MGTGKWHNAPLYQKGCCAPEADGRASAKSKPRGEVPANVSGGVARRCIALRVADHPPRKQSVALQCFPNTKLMLTLAGGGHRLSRVIASYAL